MLVSCPKLPHPSAWPDVGWAFFSVRIGTGKPQSVPEKGNGGDEFYCTAPFQALWINSLLQQVQEAKQSKCPVVSNRLALVTL